MIMSFEIYFNFKGSDTEEIRKIIKPISKLTTSHMKLFNEIYKKFNCENLSYLVLECFQYIFYKNN